MPILLQAAADSIALHENVQMLLKQFYTSFDQFALLGSPEKFCSLDKDRDYYHDQIKSRFRE